MYSAEGALPEDRTYVLAHLTNDNWHDKDDPEGNRYWTVVKFVRGLSMEDRNSLDRADKRRRIYRSEDEDGNNRRPYCWQEFGPSTYFGQDVDYWCHLPLK